MWSVGGVGTLAALLLVIGLGTTAASTSYTFVVRGVVESVNTSTGVMNVTGTFASAKAIVDTQSKNIGYSVKNAKFTKWENGVRVKRNIKHVAVGDEVVLKGSKTTGGSFVVDELTVNDRGFEVVGRVRDIDTEENSITVVVGRSTYKHKAYVNKEVKVYYIDDVTKCRRLGTEIDCSEIQADNQGIKVKGGLTGAEGKWEISHAWNQYPL